MVLECRFTTGHLYHDRNVLKVLADDTFRVGNGYFFRSNRLVSYLAIGDRCCIDRGSARNRENGCKQCG